MIPGQLQQQTTKGAAAALVDSSASLACRLTSPHRSSTRGAGTDSHWTGKEKIRAPLSDQVAGKETDRWPAVWLF